MIFGRKKLAQRIDGRRWSAVESTLERGERPLHNTPAVFMDVDGMDWQGICYLTDKAILGDEAGSLRPSTWRLPLNEVTSFELRGYRLGVRSHHEIHVIQLYPSPPTDQLLVSFLALMKEQVHVERI